MKLFQEELLFKSSITALWIENFTGKDLFTLSSLKYRNLEFGIGEDTPWNVDLGGEFKDVDSQQIKFTNLP